MNIQEAKTEIKNTLRLYLRRDENGMYLMPPERQRPLLLMGPPGLGKTAIMKQAAKECGVGLVSYSMTHHTRQSAIGLPHIVKREYEGASWSATEYTLSEIVASIYDCMARTGLREGILFLDEINCVSETLAPVMLQLLQSKRFGTHAIPEGWILTAAGNPPDYNRAAKEFDISTVDRVRLIPVEADLSCWLSYAAGAGVHSAILSYLRIRPDRFYQASSNASGQTFVTARGWEDLSCLLTGYESLCLEVTDAQLAQFLGEKKTCEDFGAYYRLYRKYGQDYGIPRILSGEMGQEEYAQKAALAAAGDFDERYTVIGLLLGGLALRLETWEQAEKLSARCGEERRLLLPRLNQRLSDGEGTAPRAAALFSELLQDQLHALEIKKENGLLEPEEERLERSCIRTLKKAAENAVLQHLSDEEGLQAVLSARLDELNEEAKTAAALAGRALERVFAFCETAFGTEQEMLLLVTGLAADSRALSFLTEHPSEVFLRWSSLLV